MTPARRAILTGQPEQGGLDGAPLVNGPEHLAITGKVSTVVVVIVCLAFIGDMNAAFARFFLVIAESYLILWNDHLISPDLFESIYVWILAELECAGKIAHLSLCGLNTIYCIRGFIFNTSLEKLNQRAPKFRIKNPLQTYNLICVNLTMSTASSSKLTLDAISYVLGFLGIDDHIRFSLTCKEYYDTFGITTIERREKDQEQNINLNCYTVFQKHSNDDVLWGIVGLNTVEYAGSTKHVKDLIIQSHCKFIHGDTIWYTPRSLTGEGLRNLVRLDIDSCFDRCVISGVRFERLATLRVRHCNIIQCQFDVLEHLDLEETIFSGEIPTTITSLRAYWCQFSDGCVKGRLENLKKFYGNDRDFIMCAPNVKKVVLNSVELYNLPESIEYLKLINTDVYGEKVYLPELRHLEMELSTIRHIIAPKLSELIANSSEISAIDCPVLAMCDTYNMVRDIDIHSVVLMTDQEVDPKKFPSLRALYFHENLCEHYDDLGDFIFELDMIYIYRVAAWMIPNINAQVLVTSRIDKDVDLRKMSRLKVLIAPAEYATIVPASIEFIEFDYGRHGESGFIGLFRELFLDPPQ